MRTKFMFLFLVLVSFSAVGQNSYTYEIKTNLFKLGELKVTQTSYPELHKIKYNLETRLQVLSIYKIDYFLETVFRSDTLEKSLITINVNGKNQHFCSTTKNGLGYNVESSDEKSYFINYPITTGITPLYFMNYSGPDSVFSEYSGNFRPFIKKNDSTLILDPMNPMEFIFNHGHIDKVIVHNSIMNFYLELKPELSN